MKCIILLSLVALCYTYPYGTGYGTGYVPITESFLGNVKNIYSNEDGSVAVTTGTGKKIIVSKVIDENGVAITTVPAGKFQKYGGYVSSEYQPSQVDVLAQILNKYQGDVNENTYQQLLEEVNSAVQSGELSSAVYQALQNLYQNQGGYYGKSYVNYPFQTPIQGLYQQVPVRYYGNQVSYPFQGSTQQLLQQQQGFPVYGVQQQNQNPYFVPTVGIQATTVPLGVYQQGQVTYPGVVGVGQQGINWQYGKAWWPTLTGSYLYGKGQQKYVPYSEYSQYSQYPQQFGQTTFGQLPQIIQGEKQILNEQNQIQQEQVQQQQQQKQLLVKQLQQQQQQQQQQNQQESIEAVQQQVQQGQDQVLPQQNQQYGVLKTIWQQQPSVYSQKGSYGVYPGGYNVPQVV